VVERAQRHRIPPPRLHTGAGSDGGGVSLRTIVEHLGGSGLRSALARSVRARLHELEGEGLLERARRHGVEVWSLSGRGRRRLGRDRAAGVDVALAESPQHRAWREARLAAAMEIGRFRARLREQLAAAEALLDTDPPPDSDAWFELAERLRQSARRVGSAWHCLREWPEPDDARADADARRDAGDEALEPARQERLRALRAGRRNVRLWRERGC
jgi:hypothetical protein